VKVFIAFLLLMFVIGGWEFRHQRNAKFALVFGLCVVAALALRSYQFV
jgi:hypothetical protein